MATLGVRTVARQRGELRLRPNIAQRDLVGGGKSPCSSSDNSSNNNNNNDNKYTRQWTHGPALRFVRSSERANASSPRPHGAWKRC